MNIIIWLIIGRITSYNVCYTKLLRSRVGGVRGDEHHVGIFGLDRAHDRREVGGGRRIGLVVDDLEAHRLGILARTRRGVQREFGVGRDNRHRNNFV